MGSDSHPATPHLLVYFNNSRASCRKFSPFFCKEMDGDIVQFDMIGDFTIGFFGFPGQEIFGRDVPRRGSSLLLLMSFSLVNLVIKTMIRVDSFSALSFSLRLRRKRRIEKIEGANRVRRRLVRSLLRPGDPTSIFRMVYFHKSVAVARMGAANHADNTK